MEWIDTSIGPDFTYISENFNHFIQNIDESDRIGTGVILAVLIENQLIFSHIGDTSILLVEEDGTITSLNNNNPEKTEFEAISNGEIMPGGHIYLSSSALEDRISDDLLRDLSLLTSAEWRTIVHDVLDQEFQDSVHIAHIHNQKEQRQVSIPRSKKQIDILRASGEQVLSKLDIQ
jgi:serine/threonine protein phosphatase PrpC